MMRRTTRVVSDQARRIADLLDQVLDEHLAPGATFEQRQDLAAAVASDAQWLRSDRQLLAMVTTADDLAVEDRRYRRLEQPSSATYDGRWVGQP